MRVPATETVIVKPELIRLVRRADSKRWQVHYKLDGVKNWFRRSTDTSDVKEAARIAERMWMKATFDHEEGRPVISKKFKPVAEIVLRKLDEEIKAGTAKASARDYVSEPVLARLKDLVLDHDIPHLWVRPNQLTQRKTQASIRCVPLLGASLDAAKELHRRATKQKSEWLIPQYATEIGNTSCAATLNKYMRHLGFRTHMFRHAFIDRLKACGDIPVPIAEAITGHGRNTSDFAHYGSVGYTLEQKKAVIERVLV